MKSFLRPLLILALCATAHAKVVRPAPNFSVDGVRPNTSLRSFHGQTVVLVIAKSAREKHFREELYRLKEIYDQFANEKVVFVAAILGGSGEIKSDIPFVTASNPAQVAADYAVTGPFGLAVIGTDGNLDLITMKTVNAARVKDAIFNSYDSQVAARKMPESQ